MTTEPNEVKSSLGVIEKLHALGLHDISAEITRERLDLIRLLKAMERQRDALAEALRAVHDDLLTATETWRDSDAGPATVSGLPREPEEVAPETWDQVRAALAALEGEPR